jgi:hypothetical protein
MRTLVQELNISIANPVRIKMSEDLIYCTILCYEERSLMSVASKMKQYWIKENLQEVWDKEVWPLSSPDYILLDYFVCGVSQL